MKHMSGKASWYSGGSWPTLTLIAQLQEPLIGAVCVDHALYQPYCVLCL